MSEYAVLPEIPVEHMDKAAPWFDITRHALRGVNPHRPEKPDSIIISAGGEFGTFTTYLTPAMLVYLANTLLTDAERSHILVGDGAAS